MCVIPDIVRGVAVLRRYSVENDPNFAEDLPCADKGAEKAGSEKVAAAPKRGNVLLPSFESEGR